MSLDPWSYSSKTGSEFGHQTALFMWAAVAANKGLVAANDERTYTHQLFVPGRTDLIPELQWLHAIKNQGHGDAIRGSRSAMEGVKAGVPDIFLPVVGCKAVGPGNVPWYHGLYIELKRPQSLTKRMGAPSQEQLDWIKYLSGAGYQVDICFGWESARDAILKYLGR